MESTEGPRKLLQHLDTFFGDRNGIRGDPKEGVNFTLETLTYMTSRNLADRITGMIVDRMKQMGLPQFGVFECCAGIGGNTMSFLDNPAVQWVVSYELRPERRDMLKRNIAMYNLAKDDKENPRSFVQDDAFAGIPSSHKMNTVLYFDPPWLPETIKGHESKKTDYLTKGIKIGGKTLEQWITECPECAMIVMRVPPGYQLDPVKGFYIESFPIPPRKKSSLLIFATPESKVPAGVKSAPVQVSPKQPSSRRLSPTRRPRVETEPSRPLTEKLPPGVDPSETEWYEGLRNFLRETLKMILPSERHREQMVSYEAMEVWVPCFTHESFNPNVGMNYEELELVGDHAMEYNFIMYLYLTIPDVTRAQMSELKSRYISKVFQAEVGRKWGLDRWVRTRVEKNIHINEDLLESFFGAVNIVADKVFKFGAGTGLCYNMIIKIFEDVDIDLSAARVKPKTQMKEAFEKLKWGKPVEITRASTDGSVTASVSFTDEAMKMLREYGVSITNATLSIEQGSSKKVAFEKAYQVALENMEKMGINDRWIESVRNEREIKNPRLVPYTQRVKVKSEQEGYKSVTLKKVQTTSAGAYVQLIGTKRDGTKVILAMNEKPMDEMDAKELVLKQYLGEA